MIDQQDIEIPKNRIQFERQNAKISARLFRSLVIIYKISKVCTFFFNKASYIISVTNKSTCSIDYRLICDFRTDYSLTWILIFDAKCDKFRLARSARS